MSVAAVITEYNPFHNGHKYQLNKIKEITGANHIVVIMSGNFVQRGEPAIIDKYKRTEMALNNGADVIVELPVHYSLSSAEYFALGAVKIIESLGCVDYLCFGAEDDNLEVLTNITDIFVNEPLEFKNVLKEKLREGVSFPVARKYALESICSYSHILDKPNNILAIEYLKALRLFNSKITPVLIKRSDDNYNSEELSGKFASATAIRNSFINQSAINSVSPGISEYIPADVLSVFKDEYFKTFPVTIDDFSMLLGGKLVSLNANKSDDSQWKYFTKDLKNRILNNYYNYLTFSEFCDLLKTKNETLSSIKRSLLNFTLNSNPDFKELAKNIQETEYIRLLGFKKTSGVLRQIKENSSAPVISNVARAKDILTSKQMEIFKNSLNCDEIYRQVCTQKFRKKFKDEYRNTLIVK